MDPVLRLLRDLVSIDSVNPLLVPGGAGEAAVAARIATALRAAGLDVQVRDVVTGRPNVVGVLEGRAPGRSLMLCGHMDTVGVEGTTDLRIDLPWSTSYSTTLPMDFDLASLLGADDLPDLTGSKALQQCVVGASPGGGVGVHPGDADPGQERS